MSVDKKFNAWTIEELKYNRVIRAAFRLITINKTYNLKRFQVQELSEMFFADEFDKLKEYKKQLILRENPYGYTSSKNK